MLEVISHARLRLWLNLAWLPESTAYRRGQGRRIRSHLDPWSRLCAVLLLCGMGAVFFDFPGLLTALRAHQWRRTDRLMDRKREAIFPTNVPVRLRPLKGRVPLGESADTLQAKPESVIVGQIL